MRTQGFVWQRRVGFGHCDPARIAYTGRMPEFALEAIDAFWEAQLDDDNWFRMNVDQSIGTPFVHMEFDFKAPITPRAALQCHVEPASLGNISVTFKVTGAQDGRECFVAQFVSVFVASPEPSKIRVPERIRAALGSAYPALRRSEPIREWSVGSHALASRRTGSWREARWSMVRAERRVVSKSLAGRRLRPSRASVRSTLRRTSLPVSASRGRRWSCGVGWSVRGGTAIARLG
jgi:4-hydroxybenzoyl-CoA thioesterase